VSAVAFSPDGTKLASAGTDHIVRLWDAKKGDEIATMEGHADQVYAVAFSPDGKFLASGSLDQTAVGGKRIAVLKGHRDAVESLAFSTDSKTLVSASSRLVILWDVEKEQQKTGLKMDVPVLRQNGVTYSATGKALAVTGGGGTAESPALGVWDVAAGERTSSLKLGRNDGYFALSPDGKTLATASLEGKITVWELATGKETAKWEYPGEIVCMAFSPDGKTLAAGYKEAKAGSDEDGPIRLLDVANQQELAVLKGHPRAVMCLAFSPDGKTLASGGVYDKITLWDVPVPKKEDK
jgi:WD40 repeat protein